MHEPPFDLQAMLAAPDDVHALAVAMREVGFCERMALRFFDVPRLSDTLYVADRVLTGRELRPGVATLFALFLGNRDVPVSLFEDSLPRVAAETLRRTELVTTVGGDVRCRAMLFPFGDLILLADRHQHAEEHFSVPFPDISASNLARSLPRQATGRWLDVGTGTGVVALAAAAAGARVTASDLNPRALAFVRGGMLLNRLGCELCESDLFATVPQGRWDGITFNFPLLFGAGLFDDDAPVYLYSSYGEDLLWAALEEVPGRLAERGTALLHAQMVDEPGLRFGERLPRYVGSSRFRALAVRSRSGPIVDSARRNRVVVLAHGMLVLRPADGLPYYEEVTVPLSAACLCFDRDLVDTLFADADARHAGHQGPLGRLRLAIHPFLELRRSYAARGGRLCSLGATLGGRELLAAELSVVERADGRSTMAEIAGALPDLQPGEVEEIATRLRRLGLLGVVGS